MFKFTIKSFWLLMAILVSATSLQALEKVTIQLKWKHQFQFAGYYAALEKGYYTAEGLDLTLKEFNPKNTNVVDSVLAGATDYGVFDTGLIVSRLQNKPVVLIAQIFQHSPLAIVSLKKDGIKTPEDLRRKTIMMNAKYKTSYAAIFTLLQDTFTNSHDITFLTKTYKLTTGKADAVIAYTSNPPFGLDPGDLHVIDPRDYGIDFYGDNLFTTEQELINNPRRVAKVRRASLRGWKYALDNQEEIVDLILKKYNSQNKTKEQLLFEAKKINAMILPEYIDLGTVNFARFNKIAAIAAKINDCKSDTLDADFIYQETQDIGLTTAEKKWIADNPTIRVAGSTYYPPYVLTENGLAKGFSTDFIRLLAKKAGLNIKFIEGDWAELLDKAKAGKVDLIHPIYKTSAREKFLNFTAPYQNIIEAIFTQNNNTNIHSIEDLNGKNIAIVKNSMNVDFIRKQAPDAKITYVAGSLDAFKSVAMGKVDCTIQDIAVANYYLRKNGIANVKIAAESNLNKNKENSYRLGIIKNEPVLFSILKKARAAITPSELNLIEQQWFMPDKITQKTELTKAEKAWLKQHPVIRCCVINFPPFQFWQDQPRGDAIDLLSDIADKYGFKVKFVPGETMTEALGNLKKRKVIDMISLAVKTPDRHDYISFSRPYAEDSTVIYGNNNAANVLCLNDLNGKTVAMPANFVLTERLAKQYPKIKIILKDTNIDCYKAVEDGSADAYVGNLAIGRLVILQNDFKNVKMIAPTQWPNQKASFAVRSDYKILTDILNKGLANIVIKNSTDLYFKHYSNHHHNKTDYTLILEILSIAALAIFLTILWNLILRKRIRRATTKLRKHSGNLEEMVEARTKEIEKSRENLENILNTIPFGIAIGDRDTDKLILMNTTIKKMLEFDDHEIKMFNTPKVFKNHKDFENIVAELNKTQIVLDKDIEYVKAKSGQTFWAQTSVFRKSYFDKNTTLVCLYDSTQMKKLQFELINAKEQAEAANIAKSTFLANMSHEIRTPMNAILGFTEILSHHIDDPLQRNYLQAIQAGSKSLLSLINDILDLSKIEAGKMQLHLDMIDINKIAADMNLMFKQRAQEKGLEFETICSFNRNRFVEIDELRLRQLIINLVSNAIKFTKQGFVNLSLECRDLKHDSVSLVIYISDSGIGIAQNNLDQIFECFSQENGSITREFGGTGLGLSISKQICDMFGGTINIESEVNQGTNCTVVIPNLKTYKKTLILNPKKTIDPDKIKFEAADILVVDDVLSNRILLQAHLEDYGFNVFFANDGKQGVEMALKIIPKVIFMDMRMPEMDGNTAAKIILANKTTAHIPIIACTAATFNLSEEEVLASGFSAYLLKPVLLKDIIGTLCKFLHWHEVRDVGEIADEAFAHPEFIANLKADTKEIWQKLTLENSIRLKAEFSGILIKLGQQYDSKCLQDKGNELKLAIKSFNIEVIDQIMTEFKNLFNT